MAENELERAEERAEIAERFVKHLLLSKLFMFFWSSHCVLNRIRSLISMLHSVSMTYRGIHVCPRAYRMPLYVPDGTYNPVCPGMGPGHTGFSSI